MRGERPADQPDPATQRDDAGQDVVPRPATEGALVERVDLPLDAFDEAEVAGEDLVGDGGHETRRVHGAEARLAFGRGVEAVEGLERAVVDGDHPAVAGDDVERATDRGVGPSPSGSAGGSIAWRTRWMWSAILREVGSRRLVRQARRPAVGSRPTAAADGLEVVGRAPVEVDPQELALADRARPVPGASSTSRSWPSAS